MAKSPGQPSTYRWADRDALPHDGHPDYRVEVMPGVFLGGQRLMTYDVLTRKVVVHAIARRVGKTTGWDHAQQEIQARKQGRLVSIFVAPDHAKAIEKFDVFLRSMGGDPKQNPGSLVQSFHPSDGQDRWIRTRPLDHLGGLADTEPHYTGNEGGLYRFCSGQYPHFSRIQGFQEPTDIATVDESQMQHMELIDKVLNPMLLESDGVLWTTGHPDNTQVGNGWYQEYYERGLSETWQADGWISRSFPIEAAPEYLLSREACRRMRRSALRRETVIQEYDAKFLRTQGQVFDRLDEVICLEPAPRSKWPAWLNAVMASVPKAHAWLHEAPHPRHRYVIGQDWAATEDSTVLSVFDLHTRRQVLLICAIGYKGRDLEALLRASDVVRKHYRGAFVESDENGIGFAYTERQRNKYGEFVTGHKFRDSNKGEYVGRGQLLFGNAEVRLIKCDDQYREFDKYRLIERKDSEGRVKSVVYSHPPGGHDDFVDAFLMVAHKLTTPHVQTTSALSSGPQPGTHAWIKHQRRRRLKYDRLRRAQIL